MERPKLNSRGNDVAALIGNLVADKDALMKHLALLEEYANQLEAQLAEPPKVAKPKKVD